MEWSKSSPSGAHRDRRAGTSRCAKASTSSATRRDASKRNYDTVRVSPTQLDTASINMNVLQAQPGIGKIFRTGRVSDYQVSVSGGSRAGRYYLAGGAGLRGGAEASEGFRPTGGGRTWAAHPASK